MIGLPAQRDVDARHDLFDRAEPVGAIDPDVARPVEEITDGIIDRRIAFQDLLIGDGTDDLAVFDIGLRRAPPIVDDGLDRRAVDRQKRGQASGPVARLVKRRRIDDEQLFEQEPQPIGERMATVGPCEEGLDRGDARIIARLLAARADRPGEACDLVFARLDDEPQEIIAFGETPQSRERYRLVDARQRRKIIAGRKIPLPSGDLRRRQRGDRRQRAEPVRTFS